MASDWSLLPPELLQSISEKITSMDKYVHFRSVCQPWRLACIPNPRHLIPPIPWLILDLREKGPSVCIISLYDFSKARIHNIELPGVNWKDVRGHSRGWIVLQKDKELSFVNPITREVKSGCFPSLAVPPTVLGFARNGRPRNPSPSQGFDHSIITKVILTSSPSDRDCIVVAQFTGWEFELGFSRIGDVCWTILKLRENDPCSRDMWDFKCRNNSVYVINGTGRLIVYDLLDLSPKVIIDHLNSVTKGQLHLVIGEGELDGVPLLVKYTDWGSKVFGVFKCVGCEWRRVRNIGNVVLLNNYRTSEIISLGNTRLNGWDGNHICRYIYARTNEESRFCNIKIKMTSIVNGSEREVPTCLGLLSPGTIGNISWFRPSLY